MGAGPAGAAAAIIAARSGARVLLLDRDRFPRHKVCGEFVSHESMELLERLLGHPFEAMASSTPKINRAEMFFDQRKLSMQFDEPALSISRYELDAALWECAKGAGADAKESVVVTKATNEGELFRVQTKAGECFQARVAINATGRWSELSPALTGERWLGLKAHYCGDFAHDTVTLNFFDGGYCGIQSVGGGVVNVSALVREGTAKNLEQVLSETNELRVMSAAWTRVTEAVSTFPVYFREPMPVRDGMMQIGDAAGFIDPFVGDGISMALQSGVMAAEAVVSNTSTGAADDDYAAKYNSRLAPAFRNAARIRSILFGSGAIRDAALVAARLPGVLPWMMRSTRARVA